jgi:hypothetical protein
MCTAAFSEPVYAEMGKAKIHFDSISMTITNGSNLTSEVLSSSLGVTTRDMKELFSFLKSLRIYAEIATKSRENTNEWIVRI